MSTKKSLVNKPKKTPAVGASPTKPRGLDPIPHLQVVGHGKDQNGTSVYRVRVSPTREILIPETLFLGDDLKKAFSKAGAKLYTVQAANIMLSRFQLAANLPATFAVRTSLGLVEKRFNGKPKARFVLPDGVLPSVGGPEAALEEALLYVDPRKYRSHSTPKARAALDEMIRGNSRLMLGRAHGVSCPVSLLLDDPSVPIVQFIGPGEGGKSAAGHVISSDWGRHVDRVKAAKYGFGETWNSTAPGIMQKFPAHEHLLLFIDETRAGGKEGPRAILDVAMQGSTGVEKSRHGQVSNRSFVSALLFSSNRTAYDYGRTTGEEIDAAIIARLIDIPYPAQGAGIFDTLHGESVIDTFVQKMLAGCKLHFGVAGREFSERLCRDIESDRAGLVAWLWDLINYYKTRYGDQAQKLDPARKLVRINRRFAVMYAAGCLGSYYKVWPYSNEEWAEAISSCHFDHIRLDLAERTGKVRPGSPAGQLRDYILKNLNRFDDLTVRSTRGKKRLSSPEGYIGMHHGQREVWLPDAVLIRIAGGAQAAAQLKRDLRALGKIATNGGGKDGARFSVRRQTGSPGNRLTQVIAINASLLDDAGP